MKLKTFNNKEYIFDQVRKKYVVNQPEEWVRQNTISYLNEKKGYPISLMAIEKKIDKTSKKRCDIICYNPKKEPLILIECKSQNLKLNENTINQSINYYKMIKAKFILITNGTHHFCFKIKNEEVIFLKNIPTYLDIK
ncbi:MAG: restriction endonuclease subunit R [Flavobacteriales bacterium]|nr:restriction endonuclease subunit R [Flavobacteriales bacterium]|tara:strand:+ start:5069 stop:5482 length:414 start_codon:yes stop_codon:yes gene_type:complete